MGTIGTSEIALIISAIVVLFGILTFAFTRSSDKGNREYWEWKTTNKLDFKIDAIRINAYVVNVRNGMPIANVPEKYREEVRRVVNEADA